MENPGSFLRCLENAPEILAACGCDKREYSADASDYEFFRAFCRQADKLSHNRLTLAARALLFENGFEEPLSFEAVVALWRRFACAESVCLPDEGLFAEEKTLDLPPLTLERDAFCSMEELLEGARACKTPKEFAGALLETFLKKAKRGALIDLPEEAYQKQPSLYAVERALAGADGPSILRLQALRVLAENRIPLLLFLRGEGEKALSFFLGLERTVGLPELFLILSQKSLAPALAFLLAPGRETICPVLKKEEADRIGSTLYYRYPMGHTYLLL